MFSGPSSLKVHVTTHSGEKPHQCTKRDRSFSGFGVRTALCGAVFGPRMAFGGHSDHDMGLTVHWDMSTHGATKYESFCSHICGTRVV